MAEPADPRPVPDLPADLPPPLRAAVVAALHWLEQVEREAQALRRLR